jgi:hypothetical protein
VGSWLAGRFKSSVCVTIPVSFTESVPQPAVQLLLGDELQKIAQMLNFVTIVVELDRLGFLGADADLATVVIADRPLWQSFFRV